MKMLMYILIVLVIFVFFTILLNTSEGFRGGHRGHRGFNGGHRRASGHIGGYHRGSYGGVIVNRGYGSNIYNYDFDYPWYYPWFLRSGVCKRGCGDIGNGQVGCINPGNDYDECIFASDCYGC